jgi:hypothetical protein
VHAFESKRYFRFWEYSVAHATVVIRSASSAKHRYNQDLVFRGVFYTQLVEMFDGLHVTPDVPESEQKSLHARSGQYVGDDRFFFRIESNDRVCYVGATSAFVEENALELFQTPPQLGDKPYTYKGRSDIK